MIEVLVAMQMELLITFVLTIVGATATAAVQNHVQGDDVKKSAIGGFAGGVAAAVFACVTILMLKTALGGAS